MSNNKSRVASKLEQMRRDTGEARAADPIHDADLVEQLAHEEPGKPDFAAIAEKLKENLDAEKNPSFLEGTTKMTFYIDNDVAEAFIALCPNRGDKRKNATEAFSDFVLKKAKERGL